MRRLGMAVGEVEDITFKLTLYPFHALDIVTD